MVDEQEPPTMGRRNKLSGRKEIEKCAPNALKLDMPLQRATPLLRLGPRLVSVETDHLQDMPVCCSAIFDKQKQEPPKYPITGS